MVRKFPDSPPRPNTHAVFLFFFFFLRLYLYLAVLGLRCYMEFSVVVASEGYSIVVVHGLLIAMASLVAQHVLQLFQFPGLEHRLNSCSTQA